MLLYHATNRDLLPEIAKNGLIEGTYFAAREDVLFYYAETIEDEDDEFVILAVDMDQLNPAEAEPDHAGIEEPLCHTLGMSEGEIQRAWNASSQGLEDSLAIVGSLRYKARVRPGLVSVVPNSYEDLSSARLIKLSHYLECDSSPTLG